MDTLSANNKVSDSDKWDGYQFADYLNQAVKTTNSPTFAGLTVADDTNISAIIGRARIGYFQYDDYAGFGHRDMGGVAGQYAVLQASNGTTFINAATGMGIYLRVNNVDLVTLLPTGKLGVGVSPSYILHVKGATPFIVAEDTLGGLAKVGIIADNVYTWIGSVTAHPVLFMIGVSEKMRLDTSGRLGIGTSPNEVLELNHATRNLLRFSRAGAAQGWLGSADQLVFGGSSADLGILSNAKLQLAVNGNGILGITIDTSGNVTMGKSLTVPVNITLSGSNRYIAPGASDNNYVGLASQYFYAGYFDNLYYKTHSAFDEFDDIELMKNIKTDKENPRLIDNSTLPPQMTVKNEKGEYLVREGGLSGFLIGTIKKLIQRHESLEERISLLEKKKLASRL